MWCAWGRYLTSAAWRSSPRATSSSVLHSPMGIHRGSRRLGSRRTRSRERHGLPAWGVRTFKKGDAGDLEERLTALSWGGVPAARHGARRSQPKVRCGACTGMWHASAVGECVSPHGSGCHVWSRGWLARRRGGHDAVAEDPTARVPIAEARYPRRVLLRLRTLSAPEGRAISSGALRVVRIARSRLLRQVLAPFVLLQALCVGAGGCPLASRSYVRFALGMGAASALALVGCLGRSLERRLALFSRLARTREARRSYYERLTCRAT